MILTHKTLQSTSSVYVGNVLRQL